MAEIPSNKNRIPERGSNVPQTAKPQHPVSAPKTSSPPIHAPKPPAPKKKKRSFNKFKQTLFTIIGLGVVLAGIIGIFQYQKHKARYDLASRISNYGPRKGVPRTIDDLEKAIASYEYIQNQHVKDAAQTGVYWKILAIRFQDKEMFVEAVKALEKAIQYTPNDEILHYLTGLNAAYAAKSSYDYDGNGGVGKNAQRYYNLAEAAYLRAVELEPQYTQVRYALAVLYIFELNRPEDGIQQLLLYMEGRSGDPDSMFLMARALYMTGRYREALDWYDRGIPLEKNKVKQDEAKANRRYISDLL